MTGQKAKKPHVYDLVERTAIFGETVITFAKKIPKTVITVPLIAQFIKSGTSIGANYCEADSAESRRDFEHKIGICKKEAKECSYWLRMITNADPELTAEASSLEKEVDELNRIFIVSIKTSRGKVD